MASTVILGAGIIGVSNAYYLSDHQDPGSIHLVEPCSELFCSASGLAGGFLAKDWFGPAAASLGALSFEEHRKLAEAHGGRARWGYSGSTSISYKSAAGGGGRVKRGEDWLREGVSRSDTAPRYVDDLEGGAPSWLLRQEGDQAEKIGDAETTAQMYGTTYPLPVFTRSRGLDETNRRKIEIL